MSTPPNSRESMRSLAQAISRQASSPSFV